MPGRIGDKAREVSSGARNPYDAAVAIEEYLRTFPIDYAVPAAPDRQDPRRLLPVRRAARVLRLPRIGDDDDAADARHPRSAGIGVRDRCSSQRQGDTYKLTQQQAFAWPEVYFPGAGWVEFNPTPSQPLITRPTTPQTEVPPEPPLPAVTSNNGGVGGLSVDALPSLRGLLANLSWLASRDVLILITLFVVLASAAAAYAAWELGVRGLTLPGRAWESSIRLASLSKQGPQPHETPRAYADRLAQAVPEASDVRYIAATYERVRFGSKPMSADETRRLRSAWSSTRLALVRRILHVGRRPTRDDGPMAPE